MSTAAVLGSSFRWGGAMIFFEEEFDLLDAFIGEGQDPWTTYQDMLQPALR
jgi:hypothetical protein